MAEERYDAVVVGAGHNGLVCALYLCRAGWKTLVLERNEKVGGAVQSGEITRPGFVHDLYSMNQNLFLGSPVYAELQDDLERQGLSYKVAEKSYSNVYPGGKSLRVYKDVDHTMDLLREHNERDAEGFGRLFEQFQAFSQAFLPVYGAPLPSFEAVWDLLKAVRAQGVSELTDLMQIVMSSTRELGAYFGTDEMRALIATWGMHMDFGPDVSGGGMFPFLETFTDMVEGMSITEGGASKMPEALAALIEESGGEIRMEAEVGRILTENGNSNGNPNGNGGRATGVELVSGEKIGASRAVVANLTPSVLFGNLLSPDELRPQFRRRVRRYERGPGTMMVHLALSGRPRWEAGGDLDEFAYVHIAPYVEDLSKTYTQSMNGYLPESPLLIVGQTSAVDPSRTPGDEEILWIQVRTLPSKIKGDAAGKISARTWEEAKEPFAERVMQKLEEYAPRIGDLVLDRVVFSPEDLERHNPNLVGGDSIGGSFHLKQNFVFRPFPGWSNYKMPLGNLYMVGAATWPGPGTNATSGYLAAQEIIGPSTRDRLIQGGAAVGAAGAATVIGALALRRLLRRS